MLNDSLTLAQIIEEIDELSVELQIACEWKKLTKLEKIKKCLLELNEVINE